MHFAAARVRVESQKVKCRAEPERYFVAFSRISANEKRSRLLARLRVRNPTSECGQWASAASATTRFEVMPFIGRAR